LAAGAFFIDPLAAGGLQGVALQGQGLIVLRKPSVADAHARTPKNGDRVGLGKVNSKKAIATP
jgi:hypothetical protein